MDTMTHVQILLGETLVGKNGEAVRKSWGAGQPTCKADREERREWGEDVGWSILDAI